MLKGKVRAATLLVGLATAMATLTAAAQYKVTVPAGTRILIRTIDSIDSSQQKAGYRFNATLETSLQADNMTVAPRGTRVYGVLSSASSAGRMKGSSELGLELTDIVINGTAYPLLTSSYEIEGIGGGGKGAGIGARIGGGAGTAVASSKKGQQLSIPSESLLEFRLAQPVDLPAAR